MIREFATAKWLRKHRAHLPILVGAPGTRRYKCGCGAWRLA